MNINTLLFITILLMLLFIYKAFSINIINNTRDDNECKYLFHSCAKRVLKDVSIHNIVVLSSVSIKYKTQIENFWISSAVPNNFTKILFIAADYEIFDYCKTFTRYVLLGKLIINQTNDAVFMNKDYTSIILSRWEIIILLLSYNLSVLINDVDIFFNKNPIPFLLNYREDIVISVDHINDINAGF